MCDRHSQLYTPHQKLIIYQFDFLLLLVNKPINSHIQFQFLWISFDLGRPFFNSKTIVSMRGSTWLDSRFLRRRLDQEE